MGYHDVNTSMNNTLSLLQYLKIKPTDAIMEYVFFYLYSKMFSRIG